MSQKEAYIFAIENETKSKNLYAILANNCRDSEATKTFHQLESLEKIHEEKLIEAYRKQFGNERMFDTELRPKIDVRRNLSDPKSVLEFAIDREISMADQYQYMAENSDDKERKEFFEVLAREEQDHKVLLETEMNRIHGTMTWFDESELNGLMEY